MWGRHDIANVSREAGSQGFRLSDMNLELSSLLQWISSHDIKIVLCLHCEPREIRTPEIRAIHKGAHSSHDERKLSNQANPTLTNTIDPSKHNTLLIYRLHLTKCVLQSSLPLCLRQWQSPYLPRHWIEKPIISKLAVVPVEMAATPVLPDFFK